MRGLSLFRVYFKGQVQASEAPAGPVCIKSVFRQGWIQKWSEGARLNAEMTEASGNYRNDCSWDNTSDSLDG